MTVVSLTEVRARRAAVETIKTSAAIALRYGLDQSRPAWVRGEWLKTAAALEARARNVGGLSR